MKKTILTHEFVYPSIHANALYLDDKVYIGRKRNRFVLFDYASKELWANEYFMTETEVRQFVRENGFILVESPLFADLQEGLLA